MLDHRAVERDRAVEPRLHQLDAPARGIHLLAPEDVGRTCRQAEAAVDAVLRQLADHRPSTASALLERTTPSDSVLLGVRPGAAALPPCNRLSLGQLRNGRACVSV